MCIIHKGIPNRLGLQPPVAALGAHVGILRVLVFLDEVQLLGIPG